jgi:transposase
VAAHARSFVKNGYTTIPEHRPKAHQRHLEWTPGRIIAWAGTVGTHCAAVVQWIIESKPHPEQGYRSCLGLLRLTKSYGNERVEAACRRALKFQTCTYRSIKSILAAKLDAQPLTQDEPSPPAIEHANVRGRHYYN